MGSTVYGRRYLRRMERALGEQLVHAVDNLVTTVDHRHFAWDGQEWHPVEPADGLCGLEGRYASCGLLFGTAGYLRGLMRGPCHECRTHGTARIAAIKRGLSGRCPRRPRPRAPRHGGAAS